MLRSFTNDKIIVEAKGGLVDIGTVPPSWKNLWSPRILCFLIRTKVGRIILFQDNVTDASLFNLPVQANGSDGFKMALCLISCGLEGMDARVVHYIYTMR